MLVVHPNEAAGLLKHLWLVAHHQVLRAALRQDVLRHAACIGCVQRAVYLIEEIEGRRVGSLQGKAECQRGQGLLPTCMAQQSWVSRWQQAASGSACDAACSAEQS